MIPLAAVAVIAAWFTIANWYTGRRRSAGIGMAVIVVCVGVLVWLWRVNG